MNEKQLTEVVCQYIRVKYPNVIFTCDTSGLRLTIGQARQMKKLRSSRGLPDLMIFAPRGRYNGLFIELKTVSPFKKNGDIKSDDHLEEQADIIRELVSLGYCANFCTGYDEAVRIIDEYLS